MFRLIEPIILVAIAITISAVVTMMLLDSHREQDLHAQPQDANIIIVDVARLAAGMVSEGDMRSETANAALVKVMADIEQLKNKGYIVIDANMVIKAPESYYYKKP